MAIVHTGGMLADALIEDIGEVEVSMVKAAIGIIIT
jgi:hypothetical protein